MLSKTKDNGSCPFGFGKEKSSGLVLKNEGPGNDFFWAEKLDLAALRQNADKSNPMDEDFNYREEFKKIDYWALKEDLKKCLTDSQDWWPADYGNYGGFFIRMAWHSAGTYRQSDGRGGAREGQQRFEPINSWPDNANLDKARRLLWPIKQKYGRSISWADLMILAGNVAYEEAGFKTVGFSGGREDVFEAAHNIYWGAENELLGSDKRYKGEYEDRDLEEPLAASHLGLIYVNPEGPEGNPDPMLAAKDIRITFKRMGMNDKETVALIAGGHTLGKTHGAAEEDYLGKGPAGAGIEHQGLGWHNEYKTGKGPDQITSGLEVIWSETPTKWSHNYFKSLLGHEWELVESPGGKSQWQAVDAAPAYPDAFDKDKKHIPTMLTTDISLKVDPAYAKISKHYLDNPEDFEKDFAEAWFKLLHRDMGPKTTYVGPEAPDKDYIWQDPIPANEYNLSKDDIDSLKAALAESGASHQDMIYTAWSAASTYRNSDRRGGANGARIRLEPQINWESNDPDNLKETINKYELIQDKFNNNDKYVSIADLIILGGSYAIDEAINNAGFDIKTDFKPGRNDASQEQTDVENIDLLEPAVDGFRNYLKDRGTASPEKYLIDKAQLLTLSVPEMTALVGGFRSLGINHGKTDLGVFTSDTKALSNDFFVNLLDMKYKWVPSDENNIFNGIDRESGKHIWRATRTDLIFGSNAELRAVAEIYASADSKEKFIKDFVKAWNKVINLDRFDLLD